MWAVGQKHADVVAVLLAHGADLSARSDVWSQMMAVPPHGYMPYNKMIPAGGETALLFAARVGDLESAKLLVARGANVNDADAWGVSAVTLAAHSRFTDLVEYLLDRHADPNAAKSGFTALHEAIMHRDERMVAALLDHGANPNTPLETWTPMRRSADDYNFAPELVGATPGSPPSSAGRAAARQAGAERAVHHGERHRGGRGRVQLTDVTTALTAATGMVRSRAPGPCRPVGAKRWFEAVG